MGCTSEIVRVYYNELAEKHDLPPRVGRIEVQKKFLYPKIKELYERNSTHIEIAEEMGLSPEKIWQVLVSLSETGEIRLPPRPLAKYEEFDPQIIELWNVEKLGERAIAERLGISNVGVRGRMNKFRNEGKIIRVRKKRRSKEELLAFEHHVRKLREEGLANKDITERLETSPYDVASAIKRMLNRGEIPRKVPFRPRRKNVG